MYIYNASHGMYISYLYNAKKDQYSVPFFVHCDKWWLSVIDCLLSIKLKMKLLQVYVLHIL